MNNDKNIKVGKYDTNLNNILGINIGELDIYRSKGLTTHMIKRKHYKCLQYVDYIPDILRNPDYVGVNPNEKGTTFEFVKCYQDNVLVGVKLDTNKDYLYISSMYDIQKSKISRRLHSGRLKRIR